MIRARVRELLRTDFLLETTNASLSVRQIEALLSGIAKTGSLTGAAGLVGCSYRHAWGTLRALEQALGERLVETTTGGRTGGGSALTGAGTHLRTELREVLGVAPRPVAEPGEADAGQPSPHVPVNVPANMPTGVVKGAPSEVVVVAATMESVETGLIDAVAAALLEETGIRLAPVAAGSGAALELARSGRIDLTLTHAPDLESRFVADGWGERVIPIMTSRFVIVGPLADPAGVVLAQEQEDPLLAFARIARGRWPFVSRGDRSGTHLREARLWEEAGVVPSAPWYHRTAGTGNRAVLADAATHAAYTLVDEATVERHGLPSGLTVLFRDQRDTVETSGTPEARSRKAGEREAGSLVDRFSLIPVQPGLIGRANSERCRSTVSWIVSRAPSILSTLLTTEGKPLFAAVDAP